MPVALNQISNVAHLGSSNSHRSEQNLASGEDVSSAAPRYDTSPGHDPSSDIPSLNREEHAYEPLAAKDIRLIRLRPSEDGIAIVEAELVHLPLAVAQDSNYVALSYCWGSFEPSVQIKLDDQPFWVRPNVSKYLKRFRTLGLTLIWVSGL
jgi:hypothetical protein